MYYKEEFTSNNADIQTILDMVNALPDVLDTSDATAAAGDIASGKTAYVNGVKVTGNLEPVNITKVTLNKSTVTSTIQNDAFKGKTNIVGQNWSFGRTVVIWVYIINGGYDGFVYHETAYRPTFSLNASTGELKSNYNFAAGDWTFYVW